VGLIVSDKLEQNCVSVIFNLNFFRRLENFHAFLFSPLAGAEEAF